MTGTLTYGNSKVSKIYNYAKYNDKQLLKIVSYLENNSSHPISRAFKEYFDDKELVTDFKNIPGIGLYGKVNKKEVYVGNNKLFNNLNIENKYLKDEEALTKDASSIIYVIENNKVISLIGVKDVIRSSTIKTIKELKKMNKNIVMLSGDNEKTANIIASQIGIDRVIANVMPNEKEYELANIMKNGKVMMVGDGINDAPSLVRADIGVSMNSATDIAGNSADVILMNDDLSKIISLLKISKKTVSIIKQNLFWAFIYNILMIPIAIGLLKPYNISISPMIASVSMTISSLTVVFNSLRLRRVK
jgi:Cu+-exporting ATPase